MSNDCTLEGRFISISHKFELKRLACCSIDLQETRFALVYHAVALQCLQTDQTYSNVLLFLHFWGSGIKDGPLDIWLLLQLDGDRSAWNG